MIRSILIIGGDRRQLVLADMLKDKGYSVSLQGFGKLEHEDEPADSPGYIFLPIPYSNPDGSIKAPYSLDRLELADIVRRYPQCVYVLGGYNTAAGDVFDCRIRYIDLLANEAFLIKNALLTAQGAVCAFHTVSETALCDLKCAVVGFGRIARFLCRLLQAHGAQVTATARKDRDLELIAAEGMRAARIKDLCRILPEADAVFNTVPHHVFEEAEIKSIRSGVQVMELASPPYGMDIKLAAQWGVDVRVEPGLPGRYFPASAARAMLRAFESEEKTWN